MEIGEDVLFQMDILICVTIPSLLIVGNVFMALIVHHEWFGGDPQKRSAVSAIV